LYCSYLKIETADFYFDKFYKFLARDWANSIMGISVGCLGNYSTSRYYEVYTALPGVMRYISSGQDARTTRVNWVIMRDFGDILRI